MTDTNPQRGPGFIASGGAFVVALLACLILQFAAVAKALGPNPKLLALQPGQHPWFPNGLLLDYVVAVGELVVTLLLMGFHRRRFVWPLVSMMFAAFAGYALYWTVRGEKCGCFGKLWEPPLGTSLAIDVAMVFLALLVGGALGLKKGVIALVLALSVGMGGAGFVIADRLAPPKRTEVVGQSGADRLLASDVLKDVREQPPGGPRWYVFIYDPSCHVCEQMKPMVEMFEQQYAAGAPNLRVRQFSVPDLKAQVGIEDYEWMPTPTVLLIKDGAVVRVWRGEGAPIPDPEFAMQAATGAHDSGPAK